MSREEKIQELHELYGWKLEELHKHNDNQINMLYSACKNEDGTLRSKEQ